MKAILLLTASGPMVILTSYDSPTAPGLLKKLEAKGISKFIAYELPLDLARQRYGGHFIAVQQDLHESDDLRVLDYSGERAFSLFHFDELGPGTRYEGGQVSPEPAASLQPAQDVQ
ncbi:MAG: cytosolic protein [Gammaproteobacteria bacterium]